MKGSDPKPQSYEQLPLQFQLYDCSAGQSDCSQCRAVPEEYGCVWCSGTCVYNQSCTSVPADTCPPPQITQVSERCSVLSSSQMTCPTPAVTPEVKVKGVWFQLDNVRVHYETIKGKSFTYYPNPEFFPLNREAPDAPYRFKPGGVIAVEGQHLTRAISRQEVKARLGDRECEVKTLDNTHLYCEPPEIQPLSVDDRSELPCLKVFMGNLEVELGRVQYDSDSLSVVPLAAQISLAAGAAVIILSVLVVILMYRRKSKQALRDYKKVLLQLETLEINVGDQCRKEFTVASFPPF
ncbi:plexin-B3-like [Etheostoma cragini]|uniref:plexin-B3-like n=1 Tax=Etheostoma cragini TaxID=417921 RepID=UPI00155E127F|nr:plexin-B3-like [Etheostoma cragini]